MKKIGLLLDHYSFRTDVREFLPLLCEKCEVVVFTEEQQTIPLNAEFREIRRRRTFKNKLLDFFFDLFGKSSVKKSDTLRWGLRRLNANIGARQLAKLLYLCFCRYSPKFISSDVVIDHYDESECDLSDISEFILFSDIKHTCLLSKLRRLNINSTIYVYSWDHPSKLIYVPTKKVRYLVWNEEQKKDLIFLHNIPSKLVTLVGSTQLTHLNDYLIQSQHSDIRKINKQYIYFAATWGRKELAYQEVYILKCLSEFLEKKHPEVVILFRPYPNLDYQDLDHRVLSAENIEIDNYFNDREFIFDRESINQKYSYIENSIAVIHCGSTFGMEASYFDVPSLLYTFKSNKFSQYPNHLQVKDAMKQHHLQKYLVMESYDNVINSLSELDRVIEKVIQRPSSLLAYNHKVSSYTELMSLEDVVDNILLSISELSLDD